VPARLGWGQVDVPFAQDDDGMSGAGAVALGAAGLAAALLALAEEVMLGSAFTEGSRGSAGCQATLVWQVSHWLPKPA
jgi:hypothetical protein